MHVELTRTAFKMNVLIQTVVVVFNVKYSFGWQYFDSNPCQPTTQPIVEYYNVENSQYILFSERVPWQEAKLICPFYKAQLAKIDTLTKAKSLLEKIMATSNVDMEDMWIGGHKHDLQWIWIDQTIIPTQPIDGFPKWARKPQRSKKECLAMDGSKSGLPIFIDLDCHLSKRFACQRDYDEPVDTIVITPSQWISNEKSKFILYSHKLKWIEAAAFCRTNGYRLAIIRDSQNLKLIAKAMIISRPSFENMWVAGYHTREHWRWLSTGEIIPLHSNQSTAYPPWYIKHVNRTTGCILLDRHITDTPSFVVTRCNRKKEFICEKYTRENGRPNKQKSVPIIRDKLKYSIFFQELSWLDAMKYCRKTGGSLAELNDLELLKAAAEAMSNLESVAESFHIWIGGKLEEREWVWTHTNKTIGSENLPWCDYYDDDPRNSCLNLDIKLHKEPLLYGIDCKNKQPFICMYQNKDQITALDLRKYAEAFATTVIVSSDHIIASIAPTTVIPTTASLTSTALVTTTSETKILCSLSETEFQQNSQTWKVFFKPTSYNAALTKCYMVGGILAEVKETTLQIINKILTVQDKHCAAMNFWVNAKVNCSELNLQKTAIETVDCDLENGALCEIKCNLPKPEGVFKYTKWNCHDVGKFHCAIECQDHMILMGPNEVTCTKVGWNTNLNKTTNLPMCQDKIFVTQNIMGTIKKLSGTYSGLLFIVAESFNITTSEWWIQMEFIAALIEVFPLSSEHPMGLILVSTETVVPIPYNATDTCEVLNIINRLKPSKGKGILSFRKALIEATRQIKTYQSRRRSLIFLIGNSDNNEDEYDAILSELQKANVFISMEISTNKLYDLQKIASMNENNLLAYTFTQYEHFKEFINNLLKYHSKQVRCVIRTKTTATTAHSILPTASNSIRNPICNHSALSFQHNSKTFEIFFSPASFNSAKENCQFAVGILADIKDDVKKITEKILAQTQSSCKEINLWINAKSRCSQLNMQRKIVENANCLLQQGFICEIVCNTPKAVSAAAHWNCKKRDHNLNCEIQCQQQQILIGPDKVTCTRNGWVTKLNETLYLPICENNAYVIQHMVHVLEEFRSTHSGFLFIIDESFSTPSSNWLIQLQFVASLIQVFPISPGWPMGVIMFGRTAVAHIPYKATDTCEALNLLHAMVPRNRGNFADFKVALDKALLQIKTFQKNRKTVIFFISNGVNNGAEYSGTLNNLKKNNMIISLGINKRLLTDLNTIASIKNNKLLTYKFQDHEHFKKFTEDLQKKRSKLVHCPTRLYTLPKNVLCYNQSTPASVDGVTYTAFFTPLSYESAKQHCKDAGGRLATVKNIAKVAGTILKQAVGCMVLEMWINQKDQPCAILEMGHVRINRFSAVCSRQLGFICEIGCPNYPTSSKYAHNSWHCKHVNKVKSCSVKCKDKSIMLGSSSLTCSTDGWVTLNNYTTYFPICLVHKNFENYFLMIIKKLKNEHDGYFFIFDTSYYKSDLKEELKQLEFMEVTLNIFPPSANFPVGLIIFDQDATVHITYNATSFCEVRNTLHSLKRMGPVNKAQTPTSSYNKALLMAEKQISTMQHQRRTLIFFVSNRRNNGEEYFSILSKLKKKHSIFSIAGGFENTEDLSIIASMRYDHLLMFTYKNYQQLRDTMKLIKKQHGKHHKCKIIG